jgi:hypothetical protein
VGGAIIIPAEDVWVDPASNQIFGWDGPQSYAGSSGTSSGSKAIPLNNRNFTIAGWVRPTNSDTQGRSILGRNSGQNDAYPYLVSEGRLLKFGFGTGSSKVEVTANNGGNTNVLNLNQWNFIAVRYDLSVYEAKVLAETGWLLAETVLSRAVEAETTWSAPIPTGLEGFYRLQIRGADRLGNIEVDPNEVVTWRGTVDSIAPRLLSFSSTPRTGGVDFNLTMEDFSLDANAVILPAACTLANTTVTPQIYTSPWYRSFAAQATTAEGAAELNNRIFQVTIQCQASYAMTNDTFRVCDLAGNCTDAVYTGPNVGRPSTATPTVTPTPTAIATTQPGATATATLTGAGWSADAIRIGQGMRRLARLADLLIPQSHNLPIS